MSEAIFLLLFTPSCSIMACTGTFLPLPLLTDNLNDVLAIAVASQCQCRRWLQSAEGCHNIKAPTNGFGQSEIREILATCEKNSFHILKIFILAVINPGNSRKQPSVKILCSFQRDSFELWAGRSHRLGHIYT
jgi:hypothetical protein